MNLKSRIDLIDYDYVSQLSEEDKIWLNKFTEEYTNASLNTKEKEKNLHNTDELRRDCYKRNNARNRDLYTKWKAGGKLDYKEDLVPNELDEDVELLADKGHDLNDKKHTSD